MERFQNVLKKYSLVFPHLPLPIIKHNSNTYCISVFNIELEVYDPAELENLIESVKNKFCQIQKERENEEIKANLNLKTKNIVNTIVKPNEKNRKNNVKKENFPSQSARGKMKIKNLQTNQYVPSFSEDHNGNKNNILMEPSEFFSTKITNYCNEKNITYPEYIFEKSNGVYLCKALFLNEKFESRYAYDMKAAKEDACRLIWSYIKFAVQDIDTHKKMRA